MSSVSQSVLTFQNIAKQNKRRVKTMTTTDVTVGLAEWIIDAHMSCNKLLLTSEFLNPTKSVEFWSDQVSFTLDQNGHPSAA